MTVAAGLLALGSTFRAGLPGKIPVARIGAKLADHSCGGSPGIQAHGLLPDSLLVPDPEHAPGWATATLPGSGLSGQRTLP